MNPDLAWGLPPGIHEIRPRPFNAWDQAMAAGLGAHGNRGMGSPYGSLQATVNAQVLAQQGARRAAQRARGRGPAPPPPLPAGPPPPPPVPVRCELGACCRMLL